MPASAKTKTDPTALAEQFFGQVSESLQMVFDLASRVDERVKGLAQRQQDIENRIEKMNDLQSEILKRVVLLEARKDMADDVDELNEKVTANEKVSAIQTEDIKKDVEELRRKHHDLRNDLHLLALKLEGIQLRMGHHDTRWQKAFDIIWRLVFMLIAGYILYKLGLPSAPG
jgi:hypothetical protein